VSTDFGSITKSLIERYFVLANRELQRVGQSPSRYVRAKIRLTGGGREIMCRKASFIADRRKACYV